MTARPDEVGAHGDIAPSVGEWLGVGPQHRLWVGGHNATLRAQIERAVQGCPRPTRGEIDVALLTPASSDEALYFSGKLRSRISPQGVLIVLIPEALPFGHDRSKTQLAEAIEKLGWTPLIGDQPSGPAGYDLLRFSPVPTD